MHSSVFLYSAILIINEILEISTLLLRGVNIRIQHNLAIGLVNLKRL